MRPGYKAVLFLIVGLLLHPAALHAGEFPWSAPTFFHDCANVPHAAEEKDPAKLLDNDRCIRYMEGFEIAAQGRDGIPAACLLNPIVLFIDAYRSFDKNNRNASPEPYLRSSMLNLCEDHALWIKPSASASK